MSVECSKNEVGVVICRFFGRMETTKCIEAEKDVMTAVDGANRVIFNLEDVEYIASSFLRLCGKASNRVSADNFSVINITPAVKKVFRIAGLAERLNLN